MRFEANEPGIHIFAGFTGTGIDGELKHLIREFRPGGIVLFRRNIHGPEQIKNLVADAQNFAIEELGRPLLVAIDQEGGTVQRLPPHFTDLPAAKSLAEQGEAAVSKWAATAAADLKSIGIHVNFAPVLDIVPRGVGHFMESRSLGQFAETVSHLGRIWIETLQVNGISATAKHFPGLGRAMLDPHHFTPVIENDDPEKFRYGLIPFESAIEAGAHCMMSSHAVYPAIDPAYPATLSFEINQRWLRERLGFSGILFSDDLDMAAIGGNYSPELVARLGLLCGTDFFLLCQRSENIAPFYKALSGIIKDEKPVLDAHLKSVERIAELFRFHFGS